METNIKYKCGICGKAYEGIEERMNCELACLKKKKEEEKKAAEAKKKAEKNTRQSEVTKAIDNAYRLVKKYIKDYGEYSYNGDIENLDFSILENVKIHDCSFLPSKILHHFWF